MAFQRDRRPAITGDKDLIVDLPVKGVVEGAEQGLGIGGGVDEGLRRWRARHPGFDRAALAVRDQAIG